MEGPAAVRTVAEGLLAALSVEETLRKPHGKLAEVTVDARKVD